MQAQATPDRQVEILIAEDDPIQAERLRFILERSGYSVLFADDGAGALALLETHDPAMVITDVVLPNMTGFELCRRIKGHERTQGISVVLLTALSDTGDVLQALACGADNFVTTPYTDENLLLSVEQILVSREPYRDGRVDGSVEMLVGGTSLLVTASQQQTVTPLVSTSEAAVQRNPELIPRLDELSALKGHLEELEANKTAALEVEIAEGKRVEEALRSSEMHYRSLFETATDGILILDGDTGAAVDANPALCELLGYPRQRIVGETLEEMGFFKDEGVTQARPLELQGRKYVRYEDLSLQVADGRRIELEMVSNANLVDHGKTIECRIRDVTERRLAQAALRESENRYHELFDRMSSGVAVYVALYDGADFALTEFNRASERIDQVAREDVIGRSVTKIFPAIKECGLFAVFQRVWRTGEPEHHPASLYRDQRISGWRETYVYRLPSGEIVAVYDDVTERVRAEAEREELTAEFLQAQKMEVAGRLAGGVAHDFNNLLTVIGGYGQIAMSALGQEDPLREYLREVLSAGDQAAVLTRQLLAFSRRQVIELRPTDLNELVLSAGGMLRRVIRADIELVTSPGSDLGAIEADPGQIEQLLVNLAVNASDAMPTGGRLLIETSNVTLSESYARTHPGTSAGEYVMLRVSDTGAGMTDEVKAHLFEPFFTTKARGEGPGLGLATVYRIVQERHGSISVSSELGKGTTFQIHLPRVDPEGEGLSKVEDAGELAPGGKTILVAEDEPRVRALTCRILERLGHTVLGAANGDEALRLAMDAPGKIDLLLTDVVMPLMGGRELVERLEPQYPQLKVIFTSGYTDDSVVRQGILDQGLVFLQKPYTPTKLADMVGQVLTG